MNSNDLIASKFGKAQVENPDQLQQLLCDDRKEDAATGLAQSALKAFCYQG
jgi:hypothetical protein